MGESAGVGRQPAGDVDHPAGPHRPGDLGVEGGGPDPGRDVGDQLDGRPGPAGAAERHEVVEVGPGADGDLPGLHLQAQRPLPGVGQVGAVGAAAVVDQPAGQLLEPLGGVGEDGLDLVAEAGPPAGTVEGHRPGEGGLEVVEEGDARLVHRAGRQRRPAQGPERAQQPLHRPPGRGLDLVGRVLAVGGVRGRRRRWRDEQAGRPPGRPRRGPARGGAVGGGATATAGRPRPGRSRSPRAGPASPRRRRWPARRRRGGRRAGSRSRPRRGRGCRPRRTRRRRPPRTWRR